MTGFVTTLLLVTTLGWSEIQPAPPASYPASLLTTWPTQGWSLEYGPETMTRRAHANHVGWIAGMRGYTSVPDCRHLGDLVEAQVGKVLGRWRVADCTRIPDLPALRNWHRLGVAITMEVDNETAVRYGWDWYGLGHRGPGHVMNKIIRFIKTSYHR
jgi:hypothetical protein